MGRIRDNLSSAYALLTESPESRLSFGDLLHRGVVKPTRGHLDYLRYGQRYPQNIVFIAGLAKSGSSWIANMFADVQGFQMYTPVNWRKARVQAWDDFQRTDLYPGMFGPYRRLLAVVKGHTWGHPRNAELLREQGLKYILTIRDPRDMLISNYHYQRNRPNHWGHAAASSMDLGAYISRQLESGAFEEQTLNWIRSWLEHRDKEQSLILRYEDGLSDAFGMMDKAFGFLGFGMEQETVRAIVEGNSFKRKSGRTSGQEDTRSFMRKGIAGEWREVYNDRQKGQALDCAGEVLGRLGYPLDD